jgi:hypothetical protein
MILVNSVHINPAADDGGRRFAPVCRLERGPIIAVTIEQDLVMLMLDDMAKEDGRT